MWTSDTQGSLRHDFFFVSASCIVVGNLEPVLENPVRCYWSGTVYHIYLWRGAGRGSCPRSTSNRPENSAEPPPITPLFVSQRPAPLPLGASQLAPCLRESERAVRERYVHRHDDFALRRPWLSGLSRTRGVVRCDARCQGRR